MGAAVATFTVTDNRYSLSFGNKYSAMGPIAITASPATYTHGGIACNLLQGELKASRAPWFAIVQGISGFVYVYIPGADASLGLLKIFTGAAAQAALTELTDGANIPAGVSGDTISAWFIFQGME